MFRKLWLLPLLLGCAPLFAHAYVRTMGITGLPLYWANSNLRIFVNPVNANGLAEAAVGQMFSDAFRAWNVPGSSAGLTFSSSPGHPASDATDGVNAVYFASRAGRRLDSGVVAMTEILYYTSSGQVAEADIVFNDRSFTFTNNPGDTGRFQGGRTLIYLQDVATHEAGHAYGLDHSTVGYSSMIYRAFTGQFVLSRDDTNAMRTLYPAGGSRGALRGTVSGLSGGIFGAHVLAVNLESGKVEAGSLADPAGNVRIGDIPAGNYAVMMEPLGVDPGALSSYFENVNHYFCGRADFRRRFYAGCGSPYAAVLNVRNGETVELGTLAPSCSQLGNPQFNPSTPALARELPGEGGAAFGTLRTGETHYYRIRGVNGALKARAIAQAIYSPVDLEVRILNGDGSALPDDGSVDNDTAYAGGITNYDSLAQADPLAGDYLVTVRAKSSAIPSSAFPASYDLLDASGHYLLAISVNGSFGTTGATSMSACISVANNPQSASFRAPASRDEDDERNQGGCGTLNAGGSGPTGGIFQVLLVAGLAHLALLWRRRRIALVRNRR